MARITALSATYTGHVQFIAEDGEAISAVALASGAGESILNIHDGRERRRAMLLVDFGDGEAEVREMKAGDTFDGGEQGRFVVTQQAGDGGLLWE